MAQDAMPVLPMEMPPPMQEEAAVMMNSDHPHMDHHHMDHHHMGHHHMDHHMMMPMMPMTSKNYFHLWRDAMQPKVEMKPDATHMMMHAMSGNYGAI